MPWKDQCHHAHLHFLWFERRRSRYPWPIFYNSSQKAASTPLARAVAFIDHVTVDNRPQLANSAACNIQLQTRLSRPRRLPLPLIVFYYASKLSFPTCWTRNSNLGDDLHAVFYGQCKDPLLGGTTTDVQRSRVLLVHLPPYSPDYNPIE
jgi:hypothetical protein